MPAGMERSPGQEPTLKEGAGKGPGGGERILGARSQERARSKFSSDTGAEEREGSNISIV